MPDLPRQTTTPGRTIYYKTKAVIQPGGMNNGNVPILMLDAEGGTRSVKAAQLEAVGTTPDQGGAAAVLAEVEAADLEYFVP